MQFFVVFLVLVCSLQAATIGLVEPGEHPNYSVQLPPDSLNGTGIMLQNLLKQNLQYRFGFTTQTDTGPRNLVGYFNPVDPATWVMWTTPVNRLEWTDYIPESEVFVPPVVPPIIPPVVPPVVPPVIPPVIPPIVPPVVPPPPPPPNTEIPEPSMFGILMVIFAVWGLWRFTTQSHVKKE